MTRREWLIAAAIVLAACAALGVAIAAGQWQSYWVQWLVGNVLPPSFWTLLGIGIAHLQLHRKLDAHHEDMKQHISQEASNG